MSNARRNTALPEGPHNSARTMINPCCGSNGKLIIRLPCLEPSCLYTVWQTVWDATPRLCGRPHRDPYYASALYRFALPAPRSSVGLRPGPIRTRIAPRFGQWSGSRPYLSAPGEITISRQIVSTYHQVVTVCLIPTIRSSGIRGLHEHRIDEQRSDAERLFAYLVATKGVSLCSR